MQTFVISVPSETRNLSMIREFVTRASQRTLLSTVDVERLTLAVDEACANVIEHAYGHDATREITIRVLVDDTQVAVDVIDSGASYDPTKHNPATIEELAEHRKDGGMGIRLMKLATDELEWGTDENGHNRLRLVKRPPARQ